MVPRLGARSTRVPALDVLRAIAVALVIGRHLPTPATPRWSSALESAIEVLARGGWIGVDLFFVLSGFLVSGLLFREYQSRGRVSVGRFLVRRGLKIYPAFYFFLAITIAIAVFRFGWSSLRLRAVLSEVLFVQNYGPRLWWHTWSLAIEEHFYLLCAGLIYVLSSMRRDSRDPFRAIPYVFAAIATLSLVGRVATAMAGPYTHERSLFPTHLRLDGLMFGVTLSYAFHFHRERVERAVSGRESALLGIGAALLAPPFLFQLETTPWIYTLGLTLLYVGSGLIVIALVIRGVPDRPVIRGLAWIGQFSYSIYLWHLFVLTKVQALAGHSLVAIPVGILTCVIVGAIAARAVELPVLVVRDRWFPVGSDERVDQDPSSRHREGSPGRVQGLDAARH